MEMYVMLIILAYLIGSIPSGLIVGKQFYQIDIREHGSGNLGGTNAFRVLGKKPGLIVTLADILKGTLAASLPLIFNQPEISGLVIGIAAVVGHMFPIFAKFKGGKAVATSGGMILGVSPFIFVVILATFFVSLYLSKYVSLSSIITCIVAVITASVMRDTGLVILTLILTIFIVYRHTANIKRIKNGTEPKITWL
ncbi:acyl-phosphate glycerol-3-phosphate acyltransferase [Pelagirhabdus alkalitolerans]|uniref:Glycerol-3-phosphate acyltransferase n=2 Tax=Pelagirhabdus alkalitolerans TaxID=1612202 RepID=A0A1G6H6T6_9BACI|nr:glycerol-3-phosphate 1-O-acyltransferase PlsY [Pelagirhabdus alkalitolerans]SDB89828.1 acyl-phosphate glycerol-3-phosphate acyltransferase [Pelagirhabdus alkalitolerans]